ncbi:transporter substrate-binding domain-containing protein [Cryptosporangium arvum]|uniref:transporter substrate-binding domain-containing protein n=1 Tax=Cryptosporangium arvum TaxID=80871 RepID=UPI0004B4686D|nr:transporter substrate-binding domain-containing protein [Cryptosporangium arvum]
MRTTLRVLCLLLLVVVAAVAACHGRTGEPDRATVQKKLDQAGLLDDNRPNQLRIGVYDWQPLLGFLDGKGNHAGFDVDVAKYVAANLGYEGKVRWVPLVNVADRIEALQQDRVDLVFASLSITDARKNEVLLAGPYLVVDQAVMVRTELAGRIRTVQDLENPKYRMCTSAGTTSERLLTQRGIPFRSEGSDMLCFQKMRNGEYDAISTDRSVLLGLYEEHRTQYSIIDVELQIEGGGTAVERIGVGVQKSNTALRELVDYYLDKSYRADRKGEVTAWDQAYRRYLSGLGPLTQPKPDDPPDLIDSDAKYPAE